MSETACRAIQARLGEARRTWSRPELPGGVRNCGQSLAVTGGDLTVAGYLSPSLVLKVEFSISPRAPVPGLPAASGSAHPPCPDPVPSHPAGSSLGAQLLNSLCHYGEKFLIAGPVQIGYNDKQHKILC